MVTKASRQLFKHLRVVRNRNVEYSFHRPTYIDPIKQGRATHTMYEYITYIILGNKLIQL